MDNQWTLFGLDLSRFVERILLGVRQLIWGDEAGLRRFLYPPMPLFSENPTDHLDLENFALRRQVATSGDPSSFLLPERLTLARTLNLPLEAELDLASAIRYEAEANSPFPSDDTRFGWRIVSRAPDTITVLLAIASQQSIVSLVAELGQGYGHALNKSEIWASHDKAVVQLKGFGESVRRKRYLTKLSKLVIKLGALLIGFLLLLSLPAAVLGVRAGQFTEILTETEKGAEIATIARNNLMDSQDRLLSAEMFFQGRLHYGDWLNSLAGETPNSVYLTRLGLDNDRLTVSGMAVNAAEYQTILASSGLVADLTAPSAFTRDSRTGKERFTLTMKLGKISK